MTRDKFLGALYGFCIFDVLYSKKNIFKKFNLENVFKYKHFLKTSLDVDLLLACMDGIIEKFEDPSESIKEFIDKAPNINKIFIRCDRYTKKSFNVVPMTLSIFLNYDKKKSTDIIENIDPNFLTNRKEERYFDWFYSNLKFNLINDEKSAVLALDALLFSGISIVDYVLPNDDLLINRKIILNTNSFNDAINFDFSNYVLEYTTLSNNVVFLGYDASFINVFGTLAGALYGKNRIGYKYINILPNEVIDKIEAFADFIFEFDEE